MRYGGAGAAGAAALAAAGCDLSDSHSDAPTRRPPKVVRRDEHPLNVLLIVTDSTRRDFVSVYDGDPLAHTPNLDALAKEGIRFDRAVPEAMPTVAVRRALLTGTRSFPFRDWKVAPKLPQFPGWSPIPPYKRIFTEFMEAGGIETAYVTDNPFLIGPRFERFRKHPRRVEADLRAGRVPRAGISVSTRTALPRKQQIENYLLPALAGTEAEKRLQENIGFNEGRKGNELSGAQVLKAGMETLRQLKDKQPFFLGVDAFDPHEAWNVPTTFKLRFKDRDGVEPILPFKTPYSRSRTLDVTEDQVQQVRELYAGELTYIDSWIGRLLNRLDDLGLAEQHGRLRPVRSRHPARGARPDGEGELDARQGDPLRAVHDPPPGRASGPATRATTSFRPTTWPPRSCPSRASPCPVPHGGRGPHGDVRRRRPARARLLDHRVRGPRGRRRRALSAGRRQSGQGAATLRHRERTQQRRTTWPTTFGRRGPPVAERARRRRGGPCRYSARPASFCPAEH